ncbi:MAG: hypothetical protein ACRDO8_00880 [Nocardioidaceae bacterium]
MSDPVRTKLDEIREMVQSARSMPMSSSCVISRSEMLRELDGLQEALDTAIAEAREISADREKYVTTGQSEAQRILVEARVEREDLVSDSAVFREGKRRAAEMLEGARTESEALRRETDDYVDERLGTFEFTLRKTLDAVTRGRERLHDRSDLSDYGHDPDEPGPFSGPPPQ